MTLEEVINGITILANNSTVTITPLHMCAVIFMSLAILLLLLAIAEIRNIWPSIPRIIVLGILCIASAAISIYGFTSISDEETILHAININLYVKLNDVPVDEVAKYFKLENAVSNNGIIYADIMPLKTCNIEVGQILYDMQII